MHLSLSERVRRRRRSRGQGLVEFALILPVILLVTMVALDFGRVYLGYVNLQNMARIAANFAANHPTAWTGGGDPAVQTEYENMIKNDAGASNCTLPKVAGVETPPDPAFTDNGGNGTATDVGDSAGVEITCTFRIITPVISGIIGDNGDLDVSASAEFPVKTGLIGAAGPGSSVPTADFSGTPTTGPAPLTVVFTDLSTGAPTAWSWDFESDGIIDSTAQDPSHTYSGPGLYTVTLYVSNSAGVSAPKVRSNYISASIPPAGVNFTAVPTSGVRPLTVQFTDTSSGSPTAWAWDFDNNGTVDSTQQNPTHTYTVAGTYTVKLTATNAGWAGLQDGAEHDHGGRRHLHGPEFCQYEFIERTSNVGCRWVYDDRRTSSKAASLGRSSPSRWWSGSSPHATAASR